MSDNFVLLAVLCLAICGVSWRLVRGYQIRNLAKRAGLAYTAGTIPQGFPLSGTSVAAARRISNTIVGRYGSEELFSFDCKIGAGKSGFLQTVIAYRGSLDGLGPERFDTSLKVERVDDWTLIYRPYRLLPADEIEAIIVYASRATLRASG